MNITIVGTGYVGLSLSVLLSLKHQVIALDINQEKVDLINEGKSPIKDSEVQDYLSNKNLNLLATIDKDKAYKNADFIIIATPTDYDDSTGAFNTSTVEEVIKEILEINNQSTIVIKSTVPIGFTNRIKEKLKIDNIFFSPEFLRESKALYDNLYPSRIIVGDTNEKALEFANLLLEVVQKNLNDIVVFQMSSKEAEAVKLFSNTYLAMRIAFFNELDTFSEVNNLNSNNIINGVSSDLRIGNYYNNPSFGYGGYCLPKDTQQLLVNFKNIPNEIIKSVISANSIRKEFIAKSILQKSPRVVGIYRLIMKNNSDNFRESAVLDIIEILKENDVRIEVYEPLFKSNDIKGFILNNDIKKFKKNSDLIIANRTSDDLDDVKDKVYSRDIFNEN